MGGFMGFGQSGGEKQATGNLQNIFNYALPTAKTGEASGANNLNTAAGFFQSLLRPGRTQATANAAPATNAVQDQADAARRQEAEMGTGRTGGTAAINREASGNTEKSIDDIINAGLMGGRQMAGQGLVSTGSLQQSNAAQLLGLGSQGQQSLYQGAVTKEGNQGADFSRMISSFL